MTTNNPDYPAAIKQKIAAREAVIGVVGLGYVGLPLALCFNAAGFNVIGFDTDQRKLDQLNAGQSYMLSISNRQIAQLQQTGFVATHQFERSASVDALIICVPTPLGGQKQPDLSHVINTINAVLPYLRRGQVIVLESTTYPGTTEEELLPRIESRGYKVGQDIFLLYSPEREDPGNTDFTTRSIPKICGGYSPACLDIGVALYQTVIDRVVRVSNLKTAEMTKLLENIYRAVNIGLVNELKIVADKMGINIHEVIEAAATKPFGFTPFYPGPGLGGHCIPIDPFYLTWKALDYDIRTQFIELAGVINSNMPNWVYEKAVNALNSIKRSVNGSQILILGVAYKKNVDDLRESPALKLIELFTDNGASVDYCDPYVPHLGGEPDQPDRHSVAFTLDRINRYHLAAIVADHDCFDFGLLEQSSCLILDTRGAMRNRHSDRIFHA